MVSLVGLRRVSVSLLHLRNDAVVGVGVGVVASCPCLLWSSWWLLLLRHQHYKRSGGPDTQAESNTSAHVMARCGR